MGSGSGSVSPGLLLGIVMHPRQHGYILNAARHTAYAWARARADTHLPSQTRFKAITRARWCSRAQGVGESGRVGSPDRIPRSLGLDGRTDVPFLWGDGRVAGANRPWKRVGNSVAGDAHARDGGWQCGTARACHRARAGRCALDLVTAGPW